MKVMRFQYVEHMTFDLEYNCNISINLLKVKQSICPSII